MLVRKFAIVFIYISGPICVQQYKEGSCPEGDSQLLGFPGVFQFVSFSFLAADGDTDDTDVTDETDVTDDTDETDETDNFLFNYRFVAVDNFYRFFFFPGCLTPKQKILF